MIQYFLDETIPNSYVVSSIILTIIKSERSKVINPFPLVRSMVNILKISSTNLTWLYWPDELPCVFEHFLLLSTSCRTDHTDTFPVLCPRVFEGGYSDFHGWTKNHSHTKITCISMKILPYKWFAALVTNKGSLSCMCPCVLYKVGWFLGS